MLNFRILLPVLSCTVVLVGCAATVGTPIYTLPVDSQVKVLQELSARDGKRVIIQNRRVLERKNLEVLSPYCQFLLGAGLQEPVVIRPGAFTVTKSYRRRDWTWAEGLQLAGRAGSDRTMSTVSELSSVSQPEITSLVCARWGMMNEDGWVTFAEMRATLNGLVEIIPAE